MDSNADTRPDAPIAAPSGVGYSLGPLTWQIGLLLFQAAFMVVRFNGWWRTAEGTSKLEFVLVLLFLGLASLSLWRVRGSLKTWIASDARGDAAGRDSLMRTLGSAVNSLAMAMFLMSVMFSSLLARALHPR